MSVIRNPVDHPASGPEFTERLAARVLQKLALGVEDLSELTRSLKGAWPPEVLAVLRLLRSQGALSEQQERGFLSEVPLSSTEQRQEFDFGLPEPHPLNFDWRFTAATVRTLVDLVTMSGVSSVALLGVPSLYRPLRYSGLSVRLYDVNAGVGRGMSAEEKDGFTCVDLQQWPGSTKRVEAAFADPPWYLEHYAAFFYQLQNLLVEQGKAFVSVLPDMTRPSAAADQQLIVSLAKQSGFELDQIHESAVAYTTPPFEAAALLSEGLVLPEWRTADLYVFRRTRVLQQHHDPTAPPADQWITFPWGLCSVAVKDEPHSSRTFRFESCSESGRAVLQTVSRRSEARVNANIWSSRNHVLKASRTDCVMYLLAQCAKAIQVGEALSRAQQMFDLDGESMSELHRLLGLFEECFK